MSPCDSVTPCLRGGCCFCGCGSAALRCENLRQNGVEVFDFGFDFGFDFDFDFVFGF